MHTPWHRPARWAALAGLLACLAWAVGTAAIADKGDNAMPAEGQPAPDINLPATNIDKVLPDKKDAKTLDLKDLRGKNVILYFFPKAMTRGCTIEACGFRDRIEQFARLDTVVIGISTDTLADQQKFTDKEMLPFPLYADADKRAAKAYGVLGTNGFASRSSFVIDKQGVIRKVYPKADATKHPDELLAWIKENLADKK